MCEALFLVPDRQSEWNRQKGPVLLELTLG